ncbi:MaoC dehydratase-like protein [Aneurinibacillus soli]|uniref:FAS1-like dehydratase domain-containing protein n=1 Tax=Aneurinibacillus soli TaxID=1500254 RepID=A0A0U5AWB6_9BACL|nr:MaoC family dehydratase N-terminal domain-containing protein [Aneurinibacillus soli]PYE64077.1 MaoC dehydratase-like protein [Aneurinibacillus soli]BAU28026.1 hypothetical protein CB4_02200 [Aneurinibacillus soli]
MSTPEDKKGFTFEPFIGIVEAGKIRELTRAIGDENPLYQHEEVAKEEGLDGIPIPPTFAEAIDMWNGPSFEDLMDQLDIDLKKLLHGEQEYEYLAPVYAGDTLHAKTRVTDVKTKRNGMALYKLETTYHNQRGEHVMNANMMLVKTP